MTTVHWHKQTKTTHVTGILVWKKEQHPATGLPRLIPTRTVTPLEAVFVLGPQGVASFPLASAEPHEPPRNIRADDPSLIYPGGKGRSLMSRALIQPD
ncbi:hypothetical protein E2C01_044136 [Portunus trituberculatus]|uniref:Uncharacterized protein n=1 Tax=Portunus trituberculatus TaxID=210409 RepID=A0A5B7FSC4_PORTR|nr:hypothetical protein [Portunus trituberculatus]